MRYFVTVQNGQAQTCIYEGKSHEKAEQARQMIVSVLLTTYGSATVIYQDAQSSGRFNISRGQYESAPAQTPDNRKHEGVVCFECGGPITESEYSRGESGCCKRGVVPEEQYGRIDGFTR